MLDIEVLKDIRGSLVEKYHFLGLYFYLKFLKNVETLPDNVQIDPAVLTRTVKPILDRYQILLEKMDKFIKDGLSLQDAIEKVKEGLNSPEDEELFEVFKKQEIVKDGLKRIDSLRKKFIPTQAKKFFRVNRLDILEKVNFFYDLFTGPEIGEFHQKKKLDHKNKKGKGRKK